jgi:hypothetical protein
MPLAGVWGGRNKGDSGMYECHGWFVLRTDAYEQDDSDLVAAAKHIASLTAKAGWPENYLFEVRFINGMGVLVVECGPNHAGHERTSLTSVLSEVTRVAPASYGVLYVRDDEDEGGFIDFRVHVMRRGKLEVCKDPFLSPTNPTIED